MTDDPNDFLMSGSVPSFKFTEHGATAKGPIVDFQMQQQRDIDDNRPLFWDDGKPRMQLRVVLATDQRDPTISNDDGHRAIYVKGNMQNAIRDAIKLAGSTRMEEGGTLAVRFDSGGEKLPGEKKNKPKIYRAQYVAPAPQPAGVDVDDLF